MELKYVGPKPIISHTGIEFDNNKEDKFAYLNIALQLLKAIDHDYFEDKSYTYQSDTQRYSNDELLINLKHYCPQISSMMEKQNHSIEEEIQRNLDRADENEVLDQESKETLQNNIELMHDYLVQRSVNKRVYYCTVEALTKLLKKGHIDYVTVPMFQKFAHVLHSVQGMLRKEQFPIDSTFTVFEEDGKLLIKLNIIHN